MAWFPSCVLLTLMVFLAVFSFCPHAFGADFEHSYWLLDHPDGSNRDELNVSVTSSLLEYFVDKDHRLSSRYDFGKFVTPYALEPIAESLWSIYQEEEDFANGVLMIVHQIPYVASTPQEFPVETIVANEGDCDLFSFVAASILMAGGLDTVLLYYATEDHMNVGVSLSHAPNDARSSVSYFTYSGDRYYMAETTGSNWETGWRVGECPDSLKDVTAQIITLEDAEQTSPGQVSASFGSLSTSSITLSLSSSFLVEGSSVTINGRVSPTAPSGVVTIYTKSGESSWVILRTLSCDSSGRYYYEWMPSTGGLHYVRASWSGNADHAGADSSVYSVRVISSGLVYIGLALISMIVVAVVLFALSKRVGTLPSYPVD